MPTLVYLVHGMGAGTADGSPRAPNDRWDVTAVAALQWICGTFGLPDATVVDPLTNALPANVADPAAIWVVPVTYHRPFDDYRREAGSRKALIEAIGVPDLADVDIQKLASNDMLWASCLDVLLWWADKRQARNHATTKILEAITAIDAKIRADAPAATTRRILVSHSLGTAATTEALADHLGREEVWLKRGAFEAWFTLANVAPFVLPLSKVYAPPLIPGRARALVTGAMYNARHEFDPIPRLLPPRMFEPDATGDRANEWSADWHRASERGRFTLYNTRGVVGIPAGAPDIGDVHGFANYLLAPAIATRLAGHMRGNQYSDAELADIDCQGEWEKLPALRCQRHPGALGDLGAAMQEWVRNAPAPEPGDGPPSRWVPQLLRGMELLLAAKQKC